LETCTNLIAEFDGKLPHDRRLSGSITCSSVKRRG
jgi:hypothetical protein